MNEGEFRKSLGHNLKVYQRGRMAHSALLNNPQTSDLQQAHIRNIIAMYDRLERYIQHTLTHLDIQNEYNLSKVELKEQRRYIAGVLSSIRYFRTEILYSFSAYLEQFAADLNSVNQTELGDNS